MIVQCGVTILIACPVFLFFKADQALAEHPDPKVPLFGALICGFVGSWVVMFVYVWVRFGWKAARSMKMYGND